MPVEFRQVDAIAKLSCITEVRPIRLPRREKGRYTIKRDVSKDKRSAN